jgi:hypothetical protein
MMCTPYMSRELHVFKITSNWTHARRTCEIFKLENMDEDKCYEQLYFVDKLSSLRPLDMSDPSLRHVRGTRFGSIRRDPNTLSLHCLFFSPPVGGDPDDSAAISSLLLPTCKVCKDNSSRLAVLYSSLSSNLELGLGFHLQILPATTGFRSGPPKDAKGHLHNLQGLQGSYYKEAKSYSQKSVYHSPQA